MNIITAERGFGVLILQCSKSWRIWGEVPIIALKSRADFQIQCQKCSILHLSGGDNASNTVLLMLSVIRYSHDEKILLNM